jgi:hypothetical protein
MDLDPDPYLAKYMDLDLDLDRIQWRRIRKTAVSTAISTNVDWKVLSPCLLKYRTDNVIYTRFCFEDSVSNYLCYFMRACPKVKSKENVQFFGRLRGFISTTRSFSYWEAHVISFLRCILFDNFNLKILVPWFDYMRLMFRIRINSCGDPDPDPTGEKKY